MSHKYSCEVVGIRDTHIGTDYFQTEEEAKEFAAEMVNPNFADDKYWDHGISKAVYRITHINEGPID
jgi:microsomal dipeptidase-like Zn-dependent dipeptidase